MSGGRRQSRDAALERRHPLLKDIRRRIHQAGVDVAKLLEGKQLGSMLGVLELISRRLINRHGA